MYFEDQNKQSIIAAGRLLTEAGLIEYFRRVREAIPNPYEPWITLQLGERSKANLFYELLHLGKPISVHNTDISDAELKVLQEAHLVDIADGYIVRNFKLACFDNWLCVSDAPADANSVVYIGDDSFIFSEFVSTVEPGRTGLDMGFGSGISSVALAEKCETIIAFDVVPACIEAGQMTALLNDCKASVNFTISDIESFKPPRLFDVIIGNPPGVPVPPGFKYSSAGLGGPDGLKFVRLFIRRAFEWSSSRGQIKMRFQSIGDHRGPYILQFIRDLAEQLNFDVEITIDSTIPIEVRTALSVMNVLKLSPELVMEEVFELFDCHIKSLGATTYATMLMTAKRSNVYRYRLNGPAVDLSFDKLENLPFTSRNLVDVATAEHSFVEIAKKLPNIFYLLANNELIEVTKDAIVGIRSFLRDEALSERSIFDNFFTKTSFNNELRRRALMLPFLAAVRALRGNWNQY